MFCLPSSGLSSSFSFPTTQKSLSFFSGVSSCQEYWACQAKIPQDYWWHAVWACSSMGASAFGCAQDERHKVAAVLQWQEDPPRHALRRIQGMGCRHVCRTTAAQLASRAGGLETAGVGAEDINSECFSCLGSWSFRTRIPQRIHNQLYGTMCGIWESIHQVRAPAQWAPPAQWAELEVPLRAAVRDGDVLLADDREANKAR